MFSLFSCFKINNNEIIDPVKEDDNDPVKQFYETESVNKFSIVKYHYKVQKRIINIRHGNSDVINKINYFLIVDEPYNFIIDYNESDIMNFKQLTKEDKKYYLNNNNYKEVIDIDEDWVGECYKLYLNNKTNNELNMKLKKVSGIIIEEYKPIIKITV